MVIDIYDPEQVFNNSGDGILANAGKKLLAEKAELEMQLEQARAEIIYWRNRALRADRENVQLRQDAQLAHLEQRVKELEGGRDG